MSIVVCDGQVAVGKIIPRATGDFEVFDAAGNYVCKCSTMAEARGVIARLRRKGEVAK